VQQSLSGFLGEAGLSLPLTLFNLLMGPACLLWYKDKVKSQEYNDKEVQKETLLTGTQGGVRMSANGESKDIHSLKYALE
jgi:hypothetical protein